MNVDRVSLREVIADMRPEDLSTDDRLALIELLRRCLAADREQSAAPVDGAAANLV